MTDNWQGEQDRDEQRAKQDAIDALIHANRLGLGESECMAIAYVGGFANDFYRAVRNT